MQERLQGKKVAVIGLGISNIAVISYLLKQDITGLAVFDTRTNPPYADELPSGVDFHLGPLNAQVLKQFDVLVVSPGLSIHLPEIAEAAQAGCEIVGDIELFAAEAKAPVLGITGSNGKSTVTALVGFMLEKAGMNVAVGANFGHPVFDILSDRVESYVLELSSFELETTSSLQLEAGVILNVSEDHLDRYEGDIEKYAAAKQRIYAHCNKIIVNRDDPRTFPTDPALKKNIFATFGLDNQEYGREVTEHHVYLTVHGKRVLDVRDLIICGTHNELNALAAMAMADAMGIPRDVQIQALKNFTGLEHRCQLVRVLDGVSFYNDSKATNVASAEAAIDGLCSRHKEGIILLAGGIGKGQDFTPLKRYFGKEVVKAFCFGRDADKILALDSERCIGVLNMRQAIRMAFEVAKPGQAILLSPACASFDQFKGFDERGRVFANIVNNLSSCHLLKGSSFALNSHAATVQTLEQQNNGEKTPAQRKDMECICKTKAKNAALEQAQTDAEKEKIELEMPVCVHKTGSGKKSSKHAVSAAKDSASKDSGAQATSTKEAVSKDSSAKDVAVKETSAKHVAAKETTSKDSAVPNSHDAVIQATTNLDAAKSESSAKTTDKKSTRAKKTAKK